jgi:hypothetical protein
MYHHGVRIYMILRSATSASSSMLMRVHNPRVRSMSVHHRSLANRYSITNREVLGIQVSRSCQGNRICSGRYALQALEPAWNPISGIRAWSMCSMLIRLEHIALCGHWSSHFYSPMYIWLYLWHSWIEAARDRPYTLLRDIGSTTDIWHAPYKWLVGCQFL